MAHPMRKIACAVASLAVAGLLDPAGAASEKKMTKAEVAACLKDLAIDPHGDKPIRTVSLPQHNGCKPQMKNGMPVPDPKCTPGAINPTLTLAKLDDDRFKTGCVRNEAVSEEGKKVTYAWYGITEPVPNEGQDQVCELDHLVSLELGGADTLDNLWPQCGEKSAKLDDRFFKQKDTVENYLAWLVKNDRMDLADAQTGIADDWTQFLQKAEQACPGGRCHDGNLPPPRH